MDIDQSRNSEQTWNSLQRCVNVFLPGNGHTDVQCTLQEKVYTLQWEHG